ncbi:helix-turn-helix transcriptional regulator [Planctomycetota bacterium]
MKTQTKEKSITSTNETQLLSAADCARMCGISRRSWFRFVASAKVPACVRVGASPRWVRKTLERWIELGCPGRKTFEAMEKAGK